MSAPPVSHSDGSVEVSVEQWNEESGFGFVNTREGQRAYVHRSILAGNEGLMYAGSVLQAILAPDERNIGKLRVLRFVERGVATSQVTGSMTASQADGCVEVVIDQWNEESGYGFVSTADGQRAYVHRSILAGDEGPMYVGAVLHAILVSDERNPGKLRVLRFVSAGMEVVGANMPPSHSSHIVNPADGSVEVTVDQWNEDSGYGFVNARDGSRAYLHKSVLTGNEGMMYVGAVLQAILAPDERNLGKLRVLRFVFGSIVEWNEQKGFGFVHVDDGTRAYVHRSIFSDPDACLCIGQPVRVTLKPDSRNPGKLSVDYMEGMCD